MEIPTYNNRLTVEIEDVLRKGITHNIWDILSGGMRDEISDDLWIKLFNKIWHQTHIEINRELDQEIEIIISEI